MQGLLRRLPQYAAPLLLSAASFGCRYGREEHQTDGRAAAALPPPHILSLADLKGAPAGTRVYLSEVSLTPCTNSLSLDGTTEGTKNFILCDAHGHSARAFLDSSPESLLWQLVPSRGTRAYRDFGAIVTDEPKTPALKIFKLGN